MERLLNASFFQPHVGIIRCCQELDMSTNFDKKILSYYCLKYLLTNIINSIKSDYSSLEENEQDEIEKHIEELQADFGNRQKSLGVIKKDEAASIIEKFADNQYNEALRDHEEGSANSLTASRYYNSKVFYDILEQFQPLNDDKQKRRRFAGERSDSITNDINSGRVPSILPHELSDDERRDEILAAQTGLSLELYKTMESLGQDVIIAWIITNYTIEMQTLKANRDKIPDVHNKMKESIEKRDKTFGDLCAQNNIPEEKRLNPKSAYEINQQILQLLAAIDDRIIHLENTEDIDGADLCEKTKSEVNEMLISVNKMLEKLPINTSSNFASPTSLTKNFLFESEDELSSFLQQCQLSAAASKRWAKVLYNSHGTDLNSLKAKYSKGELQACLTQAGLQEQEVLLITNYLSASCFNFTIGNQVISIDNVCKLSEKLNKFSDPSLEGIYCGTFTSIDHYHVIVKQSLRLRDIRHEANILQYLKESNVSDSSTGCIKMYGFNTEQTPSFIVLEEFGESLASFLHRNPQTTRPFKRDILKSMLKSVEILHQKNIMHGDIKPQNILILSKEGGIVQTKLCDLDSARILNPSDKSITLFPYDLSTKRLKFSQSWVSPEVWKSSEAQKGGVFQAALSIDIFPLGLIAVMLESKDNIFHCGHVLPDPDTNEFKRGVYDQLYLQAHILRVEPEDPIFELLHNMCSIDSSERKTISAIVREIGELDITKVAKENKQLKEDVKSNELFVDMISNVNKNVLDVKKMTINLRDELKAEFKNGFNILKNTVKNVSSRTHPTTFVLLDIDHLGKPKSENDLMAKRISIVNRMKGFAHAMMNPVETIQDAVTDALRTEEYLSLLCEICRQPQTGSDGKYCYKISHPKAVIGKILPLARAGLKMALMTNKVSSIGRVFGLPTPVLDDDTFSSMSSYLDDIQKDDLDSFENLQEKVQKAYSEDGMSMSEDYSAREFKRFLDEVDPDHVWCNLSREVSDEGEVLFACPKCCSKENLIDEKCCSKENLIDEKFVTAVEYFKFGDEESYRVGLMGRVKPLVRSMEEECTANDDGKWKKDYMYVVYQPAYEAVLDPSQPHRVRDQGHGGKTLHDFVNSFIAMEAKLSQAEVAALRMYTGPFYIPWNSALRLNHLNPTLLHNWQTCISVLVSAVLKLQYLSKKGTVYRGVNESKAKIHDRFYKETGDDFAGGVELAFMSTSTDENVALEYARRGSTTDCTIFTIPFNMTTRGATVQWVSQYPYENELLYPPFTCLACDSWEIRNGVKYLSVTASASNACPDVSKILTVTDHV